MTSEPKTQRKMNGAEWVNGWAVFAAAILAVEEGIDEVCKVMDVWTLVGCVDVTAEVSEADEDTVVIMVSEVTEVLVST